MNFNGYPVFDFNPNKVEAYCDNLTSGKLEYLLCVQKTIQCADAVGYQVPVEFKNRFAEKVKDFASKAITARKIIERLDHQASDDSPDSLFKAAPLYGFDPQILEMSLTNLPTLEQRAGYIIRVLREVFLSNRQKVL